MQDQFVAEISRKRLDTCHHFLFGAVTEFVTGSFTTEAEGRLRGSGVSSLAFSKGRLVAGVFSVNSVSISITIIGFKLVRSRLHWAIDAYVPDRLMIGANFLLNKFQFDGLKAMEV
jgi:hypothetical protein